MKILTPTDFSKLSKVAVSYAIRLAEKLGAEVVLMAVINNNSYSRASMHWRKLEDEMVNMAKQDAQQLMGEIHAEIGDRVKVSYEYIVGFPVEEMIENFVVQNGIDMIVMGTKGATGLKKVMMGSNAAAVIDNSSVPVISVPGETEFKKIKKIVYATDLENIYEEIRTLAMFAGLFDAEIQILHVIPSDSAKQIDSNKIVSDLIIQGKYPKITFQVSKNDHTADEVDAFVVAHKADLLAMFTHKLDFYEKLFGRSVTRQLAFHAHVPLLTFNKTTIL